MVLERLQCVLEDVVAEIQKNGAASLYTEGQLVCGGRIVVEINQDMVPTIHYERDVPVPRGERMTTRNKDPATHKEE